MKHSVTLAISMTLFASSSSSLIIDSRVSSHIIKTESLILSYHLTPSHTPITIFNGQPCSIQGHDTTCVTLSLSLSQVICILGFPVNILSIRVITHALPYTVAYFLFHYTFQDLYIRCISLGYENEHDVYKLTCDKPSSGLWALFATFTTTFSLL